MRNDIQIDKNISKYLNKNNVSDGRQPDTRYTSFDYCFNYFQSFREKKSIGALAEPENIQISCLHLGFYLASWGMLRGSATLLQKSSRYLMPAIELIANADSVLWEIDAHCYTKPNIKKILDAGSKFQESYPGMSDILVTKIMLGVFGNVPAFDSNFKKGFNVSTFGSKALEKIDDFYKNNHMVIDRYQSNTYTLDFLSGEPTLRNYTRAKVIDMAFFIEGMS